MAAKDLIQRIADHGGQLRLNGDLVELKGRPLLPTELVEEARAYKEELRQELEAEPDSNAAWVEPRPARDPAGGSASVEAPILTEIPPWGSDLEGWWQDRGGGWWWVNERGWWFQPREGARLIFMGPRWPEVSEPASSPRA